MGRGGVSLYVLFAAATAFVGCDTLRERLTPTEPTPEVTPVVAPVAIPVILTTAPTPTPAPAPKPSPTPTPKPDDPAPTGGSCSVPPNNPANPACSMQSSEFITQVDKAITKVTQQHPGWFDLKDKICENCYYVHNPAKYASAVIANLNAAGLCAQYDGEELAVKKSNSFSEQFDILLASGHIRRGSGSYRLTCRPSWF
jgi:hypothetical protein